MKQKNNRSEDKSGRRSASPGRGGSLRLFLLIVLPLAVALAVNRFLFTPTLISGPSMQPELNGGDWVIVNRISYLLASPAVGDVIVFRKPDAAPGLIVKRVAGTPGDTVEVNDGVFYRNGVPAESTEQGDILPFYERTDNPPDYGPVILGDGQFYVLGDNGAYSVDSRFFVDPLIQYDDIIGKVCFKLF